MRSLSLATVFAAASGFIVIWLASFTVDAASYAEFQAYWGLFFALTGAIDGVMQETTRAVADARETGRASKASPWRLGTVVALVAAVIAGIGGALGMDRIMADPPAAATGLLAAGLASYTLQAVLSGVLSGLKLWGRYAALVALDSGVRLLAVIAAWALGLGGQALLWVTVIGTVSWLVVLGTDPQARERLRTPVDVDARRLTRRALSAMVATGASAALITGFPVFVQASFKDAGPAAHAVGSGDGASVTVAGIILAVTLTRAPILVPLQRFQSALIVRFVAHRETLYRALGTPLAATLALGAVGALAAWAVGPWILEVAFGKEELMVPGGVLAILTFASAFTGCLMITGAATLAVERHGHYVAGWLTSSVVAFAVLFTPLALVPAVCTALIAGPTAGAAVHLVALGRRPAHHPTTGTMS
ncbi:hypothetical protein [Corynebacterium frankenforstense]|uniref:hypothetical protein n=1 Tax=Corynebacterium frankenforstense TaxID=1230998 RepID=UPI0026EEC50C|nr:hypothetical protein [Corynebacterium frankenforstense]